MPMIRKALRYVVIAIACLLVAVPASALLYRKLLQHRVVEERAITSSNGINSIERVRVGGIDQWIEIRGENVNNPILLFLHGGPGVAFIPLSGTFQRGWEKHFTVVQWDQRGAGKTYGSNNEDLLRRTMTVPQMEQDTLDLVNYLRKRFNRSKVFIVAHSWGSVLGLWLAHEHPELIYAYVGVGQVVNMAHDQSVAYQDALQQAHNSQNDQAIKDLESIAPYSPANPNFRKDSIARYWEERLLGPAPSTAGFTNVRRLLSDLISAPEYSLRDDLAFIHGQRFSLNVMLPQLGSVDLTKLGSDFRVPMFFFEGRYDPYCRPSSVWEYSQTIKAPQKEYVPFDNSGHFPFFEEQPKFSAELVQKLLPLAEESSSVR